MVAYKKTNFKDRHYTKIDVGTNIRDLNVIYDDVAFHTLDEIYFVARPSNQVGECKNIRLLTFSFMSWKMYDQSEASAKWNHQLEDFQQTNAFRELLGIDGEPTEFE